MPAEDPLPIAFVHVGISDYLPYTLAQARASNPQSRILLLGDPSNNDYPFVEHHSLWDHFDEADRFSRVYRHFNSNPVEYERFCFERWFILNRFLQAHNLDRCLYIDSDVMLYADMTEAAERFAGGFEMTVSRGLSPHSNFIMTRAALQRFCDFLMEQYTQPEGLAALEGLCRAQQERGQQGGACDMTSFADYAKRHPETISDTARVIDGSTFDHNLNTADGYAMRDGLKDIRFVNGQPYGWLADEGRHVRFNTLHFQGLAKFRIASYVTDVSNLIPRGEKFRTAGAVSASALRAPQSNDPLPIHFVTIALDAEPFLQLHIEQINRLKCDWHWHVIDGAAHLTSETPHTVPIGEELPVAFPYRPIPEHSTDGTSEYLDKLAQEFPERVTIYRKPRGARWPSRQAMLNAPLINMNQPCLLWRIDPDELWSAEQFETARQLFQANPEKTAAKYWCWFFVGPELVTSSRGGYGNNPGFQWIRTWRFRPGVQWAATEPPVLVEPLENGQWRDVATIDPITHEQTAQFGLIFQHYAYVLEKQLDFEAWYGGTSARDRWRSLQAQREFPVQLRRDYFRWVSDETKVDRAGPYVPYRLFSPAQIESFERTGVVK